MPEESERKIRVSLTKSHLSTGRGKELFTILSEVTQDGMLSNAEIERLKSWLSTADLTQIPGEQHLSEFLSQIVANGSVSPEERRLFQKEIERVLPPSQRAEAKAAREAREMEYEQIKRASTSTPESATKRKIVRISEKQQAKHEALAAAAAAHRVQPGQTAIAITIPARQPYEGDATMKQKDFLWGLGMRDQAILETLGKWQASAVIDQIKAQQPKDSIAMVILFLVVLIFIAVGLGLVAKCSAS